MPPLPCLPPEARPPTAGSCSGDAAFAKRLSAFSLAPDTTLRRRTCLGAAAAWGLLHSAHASASRIVFGYTAVSDFASVFVAAEEGHFQRRGLQVELKFIPLNSTIPELLQSRQLDMGGPTSSVYLQAVDNGQDLVTVAAGGLTAKNFTGYGLVARKGAELRSARDCTGKRIGVPGLGAFLHVTFRAWLKANKVDYRRVEFVEASFPQHADLLRNASVDAVVSADPVMGAMVDAGLGVVVSYFTTFLPEGLPTVLYVGRRDWSQRNAHTVATFRAAIDDATAFMANPAHEGRVREHIGKYIRLPPEALSRIQISPQGPKVTAPQLQFWADLLREQDLLKTRMKIDRLIAP